MSRVAAGPAAVIPDDKGSAGAAVIAETMEGSTSDHDLVLAIGAGARGSFAPKVGEVGVHFGPYVGQWLGRGLVDISGRMGPGIQIHDERSLGFFSFGVTFGGGYALSSTSWTPSNWFFLGPVPRRPNEHQWPGGWRSPQEEKRERTVLTLGLAADADVRFTRSPSLAFSILVGIAWFEETRYSR